VCIDQKDRNYEDDDDGDDDDDVFVLVLEVT